jgi:thiol:disulfide interchange protein DsbD
MTLAALAAPAATQPAGTAAGEDPTPHSDARLIADVAAVRPGEPFTVGLHVTLEDGWHTYWKNAGDAGNGVIMDWRMPAGFEVDSLRYPVPERIPYPPLMNYGYHDEVVFLASVTPPTSISDSVRIRATADFLVCADICIPASATVGLALPAAETANDASASDEGRLIDRFRGQLPLVDHDWTFRAARTDTGFVLAADPPAGWDGRLNGAYFFPVDPTTLAHEADQPAGLADDELRLELKESEYLYDEPTRLEGILVLPEGAAFDDAGHRGIEVTAPVETGEVAWAAEPVTPLAPPTASQEVAEAGATGAGLSLLVALFFAFVGGIILNLMPCVFPILSLKALGFASRGGDRAGMRADGLAFGAGVVATFLLVAGVLLAVRAGGAQVGWGYQLQSPTIVALLAALMFGIGLWLAGVVELGASLTRLGGAGDTEGRGGSFLTGVLATVVATPCTAPFMGAAIGAALIRPPVEALAIFGALGVGMAAPYVVLSFWPALAQKLPRPGRWMETFKQLLAFPMFAVAIWLVWVFGLQVGMGGAARLLFGLLLLTLAAWLVGRWPATTASRRLRIITRGLALGAVVIAFLAGAAAIRDAEPLPSGAAIDALEWETFSAEAVDRHRQAGRPVFVDFTAAWCISCQVNERVALETDAVRRAMQSYDVALLKADWTRRDPVITEALASFGRAGVPLYVLYPADPTREPRILPELLTQKIVLDALHETLESSPSGRQAGTTGSGP